MRCRVLAETDGDQAAVLTSIRALLFYPALYAIVVYRVSHAVLHSRLPPGIRQLLFFGCLLAQRIVILITRSEIAAKNHIGPGLFINHAQGAVLGVFAAGSNLTISHFATLGGEAPTAAASNDLTMLDNGSPVLGDRVWIGVGSVIAGPVTLESDSVVAANSVVRDDVPARAVVAGAPATIRSYNGSFGFVLYEGMSDDADRTEALALTEDR